MSVSTPFNDEQLREFAQFELDRHDPANQEGNGYNRCELCHYTRHPCDVYDLAAAVLRLLRWKEEASEVLAHWHEVAEMVEAPIGALLWDAVRDEIEKLREATNPGIDMDEVYEAAKESNRHIARAQEERLLRQMRVEDE